MRAAVLLFPILALALGGYGWGQEKPRPAKPSGPAFPAAAKQPGGAKQPLDKGQPELAPAGVAAPRRDPAPLAAQIDQLIEERLAKEGIPLSPPADDPEFFRRAALDIAGRIPTYEEVLGLLASDDPSRRSRWIDELLASPLYGEHFATIWNELIMPPASGVKVASNPFLPWLADQFNRNRPWDELAAEMLTAEGKLRETPSTGFIMAASDNGEPRANLLADATARLFWGVQLRCAECHDHPFAPWKQTDFWGVAAFFSRTRRGYTDGKNPQGLTVTEAIPADDVNRQNSTTWAAPNRPGPAILVPETGGKLAQTIVAAQFLGGNPAGWDDPGPYRPRFADWATSEDHPWFAANAANRLWHHFFGRGLVHPLDGFHDAAAAAHPAVLELLIRELRDTDFDLQHLIRVLCHTRAYQRTSRPVAGNEHDVELCSRMGVKMMRPEMLYDSLSVVLNSPVRKTGGKNQPVKPQPLAGVQRTEFVVAFGSRPDEIEGSIVNSGLPQFLRLMNGPLLNAESPALARFTQGSPPAAEVIRALYLSALSRGPTDAEQATALKYVADHPDARQAYAGVLWALVNSAEFVVNH